jgi:thymidylate kinase
VSLTFNDDPGILRPEVVKMNRQVVIFEGYDGAGKSSLIRAVRDSYPEKSIRVVGRKTEPELQLISSAIEDESGHLQHDTEIMLRFALETARQHIVRKALAGNDLVMLDRGITSLLSWLDYYDVPQLQYEAFANQQLKHCEGSLLVVCVADFELCWSRIEAKGLQSKKERLGREVNRRFYDQYVTNVSRLAGKHGSVIYVDTASQSLDESAARVREELTRRGLL